MEFYPETLTRTLYPKRPGMSIYGKTKSHLFFNPLCLTASIVNFQPVKSQNPNNITINSDGSINQYQHLSDVTATNTIFLRIILMDT
jgi:hypothetical protein